MVKGKKKSSQPLCACTCIETGDLIHSSLGSARDFFKELSEIISFSLLATLSASSAASELQWELFWISFSLTALERNEKKMVISKLQDFQLFFFFVYIAISLFLFFLKRIISRSFLDIYLPITGNKLL